MIPDAFKKYHTALIIAAAVVILSTLFGVNRSLGNEIRRVENLFNDGVYNSSGYRQKSIRSQLAVRTEASLNLLTLASDYDSLPSDDISDLRAARNKLCDLLDAKAGPAILYKADRELDAAFMKLYRKLTELDLTSAHKDDINSDYSRMNGAASVIENAGYNEAVRDFMSTTLSEFPTNLLKKVCFLSEPQLFE